MGFAAGTSGLAFLRGLWTGWQNQRQSRWLIVTEAVLLALFLLQLLLLAWVAIAPIAPAPSHMVQRLHPPAQAEREELFRSFDPFAATATADNGAAQTSTLPIRLFGVHLSGTSSLSSAFMGVNDGAQHSYAVGDEVMAGVILKNVAADHVTISRGGRDEVVMLEASAPRATHYDANTTADAAASSPSAPSTLEEEALAEAAALSAPGGADISSRQDKAQTPPGVMALKNDLGMDLRISGKKVTGIILSSKGPAFSRHGFQRGDVIVAINNRPVTDAGSIATLQNAMKPGEKIPIKIERGASEIAMVIWVPTQ